MNRSLSSTLETIGQMRPEVLLKNNIVIDKKMTVVFLSFLLIYTPSVMKDNSMMSHYITLLGVLVGYVLWSWMLMQGKFHNNFTILWIFVVLSVAATVLWRTMVVNAQGDEEKTQMYKTINVVMSFVMLLSYYMISATPSS